MRITLTIMKFILYLSIPLIALLASCSTTPQSRIQKNPEMFLGLSPKHQTLVKEGKIDRGMSQTAVYLAMGHPDGKFTGNRTGRSYIRWDYSVLVPVYTSGFAGFYGAGRGYYGRGGYYGGYYPSVTYVPAHGSSVYFRKGVVDGWERAR